MTKVAELKKSNTRLIRAVNKLINAIVNDNCSWKQLLDEEDRAVEYAKRVLLEET